MATFTDTIRFVVEAVTGNAERNLKGLREEVGKAEGATGKVKAGFSGIGSVISENIGLAAAGAGTALVGFAAKAVQAFTDTAREAGRLADTTGLATEEASRWLAVLKPLNVEGADLADILGNINSKAAEGRLKELGINAEDSHDRLRETIKLLGSISDETKRAQLAAELLGEEGTRQLAPLIASAGELDEKLADVSDAKVISDEEREKAAKLDKTMRDLNGIMEDLTITLGEGLAPALEEVAGWLKVITDFAVRLDEGGGLAGMLGFEIPDWIRPFIPFTDPTRAAEERAAAERAAVAPGQVPIIGGLAGLTYNVTNNYAPGTTPRETDRSWEDFYNQNGTSNSSGRP